MMMTMASANAQSSCLMQYVGGAEMRPYDVQIEFAGNADRTGARGLGDECM